MAVMPIWEVFEPRGGRTVGYAKGETYETVIRIVAELAGVGDGLLDAVLVPMSKLDTIPSALPAIVR